MNKFLLSAFYVQSTTGKLLKDALPEGDKIQKEGPRCKR